MLDKPEPSAEAAATQWMAAFAGAMQARSEAALSELLAADSHWRNLFGISWLFATFSGKAAVVRELLRRASEAKAAAFRIEPALLAPRKAVVAGREVIEAVIRFETANGPGYGAIRLLPSPGGMAQAWTISTSLDFDSICAARAGGHASIARSGSATIGGCAIAG